MSDNNVEKVPSSSGGYTTGDCGVIIVSFVKKLRRSAVIARITANANTIAEIP
jgi:hypothetical protein